MLRKVFISYRRDDTGSTAGRVYDRLSHLLGRSNVFFDVSTIGGGDDFEKRILSEIDRSDAALIFIGEKWMGPMQPTGKARVWESTDYVRAEVRAALARPILVLPILVSGSQMPRPDELPEDLRAITTKNALRIRHESFDDDTENIVMAVLGVSARKRTWEKKGRFWKKTIYALSGAITALGLMITGALVHFWLLARPISSSIGEPVTKILLIAGLVFGILMGLHYESRKSG